MKPREAIRNVGMILDDAELDQVTGGIDIAIAAQGAGEWEFYCKNCDKQQKFREGTENGKPVMSCKACGWDYISDLFKR